MVKKIFFQPIVLSLLIISSLIFANRFGWLNVPQKYFFNLTYPVQKNLYAASLKTSDFFSFLASLDDLKGENKRLKEQNQEFWGELVRLDEFARENEFLRQQLNLSACADKQLVLAKVIGQDLSGSGQYLLIDKGSGDGIKEKMAVIAAGNVLVGRVAETEENSAKIQLITDVNSRVNIFLQDSGTTGVARGEWSSLIVGLVPQGENISEGETLITSGLAGVFPAGLLVGKIEKKISNDAQVFQEAEARSAADFKTLEKVFVIKN